MYLKHFNLREEPFGTSPDPKFLYRSGIHQEALERLTTAVSMRKGINAIIGEPGLGKSTLIRTMLSGFQSNVHFAWVFNTTLNSRELLKYICRDFGFKPKGADMSELLMELYTFLIKEFEKGRINVLIIDEAQNLKPEVLEEIRQISNLETVNKKLLQIILSGQPQLDAHLNHPMLHQLKQRISMKAVLSRLGMEDTAKYIRHRMWVAGARREDIFTEAAFSAIHDVTDGVPRLINQACDNALLTAARKKIKQIDSVLIAELLQKGNITPATGKEFFPQKIEEKNSKKYFTTTDGLSEKHNGNNKDIDADILETELGYFDGVDLGQLAIN